MMEPERAASALSALGEPHRLRIFRMLMRAGPSGLSAGTLADLTDTAPSALTFHAGQLQRAGLVRSWKDGRHVRYAPEIEATRRLVTFLTKDCCNGHPEICGAPWTPDPSRRETTTMTTDRAYEVLFLCTGNSARSLMAEAILNGLDAPRFRAWSAGSNPRPEPHPFTLDLLRSANHPLDAVRSKSWDEFAGPDAPRMDFVFTVCDNAANETCPVWPGQPITAHWAVPDPAAAEGGEAARRATFADAYRMLHNRISLFVNLPVASIDRLSLQKRLDEIGRTARTDTESAA